MLISEFFLPTFSEDLEKIAIFAVRYHSGIIKNILITINKKHYGIRNW